MTTRLILNTESDRVEAYNPYVIECINEETYDRIMGYITKGTAKEANLYEDSESEEEYCECPNCGEELLRGRKVFADDLPNYCSECGQAIKASWS